MSLFSRFFHTSSRHRPTIVLIVDIGSSGVSAGLVVFEEEAPPHLAWTAHEDFVFQEELDFVRFVRSMQNALGSLLLTVMHVGMPALRSATNRRAIDRVSVVFGAPWFRWETREMHENFSAPPRHLERDIEDRIEKATQEFLSDHFQKEGTGDQDESGTSSRELIERHVLQVKVNGYETMDTGTSHARSLDVSVALSAVSADIAERVRTHIGKALHHEHHVFFHSTAFVFYALTRSLFPLTRHALLVHVDGELTEIYSVKDGVLFETISFPAGFRTIVRHTAKGGGSGMGAASSRLFLAKEKMDPSPRSAALLAGAESEWRTLFDQALAHLMQGGLLPKDVFLFAPEDTGPLFVRFIEGEQFAQSLTSPYSFSVTLFRKSFLLPHVRLTVDTPDLSLIADVLALDQELVSARRKSPAQKLEASFAT